MLILELIVLPRIWIGQAITVVCRLVRSITGEGVLAIGTAFIAVFTIVLAVDSHRQWQTSQSQLELSERPWISVHATLSKPLAFPVVTSDGTPDIETTVTFTFKNWGHSVAQGIVLRADIGEWKDYADLMPKQKELCEWAENGTRDDPSHPGLALFPGDEAQMDQHLSHNSEELKAMAAKHPDQIEFAIEPLIVGCIDYRWGTDPTDHRTRFVFDLDWKDFKQGTKPGSKGVIPATGSYPIDKLSLYIWPYGGWSAD